MGARGSRNAAKNEGGRGGGKRDVEKDPTMTQACQRWAVRRSGVNIEAGERVWEHGGVVTRPKTKGGGGGENEISKRTKR